MTHRIFVSALIAGAAVGLLAAILQFLFVVPLILEGELYETGIRAHFAAGATESIAGTPALGWDIERHGLTLAYNLITWIGFALILAALFALAERAGRRIDARSGAVWGVMGFLAFSLAPAAGLPPELPGTIGAEVAARQLWWLSTILVTAVALAVFAFRPGLAPVIVGAVLILAPHALGAPHPGRYFGVAPPELAALFATRSLAVMATGWSALGALTGWIWAKS